MENKENKLCSPLTFTEVRYELKYFTLELIGILIIVWGLYPIYNISECYKSGGVTVLGVAQLLCIDEISLVRED